MHTTKRTAARALCWAGAGIWMLALFLLSGLDGAAASHWLDAAADWLGRLAAMVSGSLSPEMDAFLTAWTPWLLQVVAYMVLALLFWLALRLSGPGPNGTALLAWALTASFAATDELHQLLTPDRLPRLSDWAIDAAAAALVVLGLRLFQWAWKRFPRLLNRETVSYVVFGVLTTLVNIVVYLFFYNVLDIHNLISNAIAWVVAVLFAYAVNKLFVFQSHNADWRGTMREFGLFIGARLFSFGVDELGMLLMVNIAHLNGGLSKLLINIVVMVINYFFSKWIIFNRSGKAPDSEDETPPTA